MPRRSAVAVERMVMGKATLVAAFPQHSDALADKNLVNDVVEGADQHTGDGRRQIWQ